MPLFEQIVGGLIGRPTKNGARYKSSPPFPFKNPLIGSIASSSERWTKDLESDNGNWLNFYPFSRISIQNNSAYSVELWINGMFKFVVANRSQREYQGEFTIFALQSTDTVNDIAANLIDVTVWNE